MFVLVVIIVKVKVKYKSMSQQEVTYRKSYLRDLDHCGFSHLTTLTLAYPYYFYLVYVVIRGDRARWSRD